MEYTTSENDVHSMSILEFSIIQTQKRPLLTEEGPREECYAQLSL